MKYAYFGIPQIATNILPDDPGKIWKLAMRYKDDKAKGDAFRQRFTGQPVRSLIDKVDGTVSDLGAGAGLGLTMLGAKLRQYDPTRQLGTAIKQHGINTLSTPELQRMYGLGVPTVALGGAGLAAKAGYDALNQGGYDS